MNDRIDEAKKTHQLDVMFTLLGYQPQPWTPIDTLIVKGDMTQTLNFTDTPLVMELLNKSLGPDLTSAWFPVLPPNPQSPYDPGPYATQAQRPPRSPSRARSPTRRPPRRWLFTTDCRTSRRACSPPAATSNNWAVAGAKSTSGGALMAGDPHLHLTLPSIWFQLTEDSPDYHTSGVSIPGTPVVLIGHNQHISWSLTDAQNQQTFFYEEKEDAAHPGQYFWKDAWHAYDSVKYDIPVLNAPDRPPHREAQHPWTGDQRARPDHVGVVGGQRPVAGLQRAHADRPGLQLPGLPRRAARLALADAQLRVRG